MEIVSSTNASPEEDSFKGKKANNDVNSSNVNIELPN